MTLRGMTRADVTDVVRPHLKAFCGFFLSFLGRVFLLTFVRSPELRSKFGEAGRRIAVRQFDVRVVIDQLEELYRRVGLLAAVGMATGCA